MKQLLISEIFPPRTGGSGRWFWEIYRRLPRDLFCVAPGECPVNSNSIDAHPMVLGRLPLSLPVWGIRSLSGLKGYWRAWKSVDHLVQNNQIERLHCARLLPEGWIGWLMKRWRGVPYLCYVHGEETNYGIQSRELGWMMRRVLQSADFLIANSHNTATILQDNWQVSGDRIRVLHPGADTDLFQPAPRSEATGRRLGWQDRSVILTVGRLQVRKGHDMLLRALPEIRRHVPHVLYAIVGEGEERGKLERLRDELQLGEHVQLLGELDDKQLIECYQQCDLFVLPNREVEGDIEGFGMVLVEAQACGRPVIAGNSGGTLETMQPGATGLLLDCNQPDELARTIPELLQDPARLAAMGTAGRNWAVSQFAWPALSEAALELLTANSPSRRERELTAR